MTKTTTLLIAGGALAAAFFSGSCVSQPTNLAWEQPPYPTPLPGDDDWTQKAGAPAVPVLLAWEQPPYPTPLPGDDDWTQKAREAAPSRLA